MTVNGDMHENITTNSKNNINSVGDNDAPDFSAIEIMAPSSNQFDDDDKHSKSSKRSNNETNTEIQYDQKSRLRRPRRNSKTSSASSTTTSTSDVVVSSLTKRLTQMAVEERQNAMYDLHGLPRDDERTETMQKLLHEMDQSIEERLQFSKSSFADGDNFGEPDLFPLLTPQQQHELMLLPKEIPTVPENNLDDSLTQGVENSQTPAIQQRIQFLKHNLDDKDFGEGLRLARAQNPEYVHSQRIKFLRADRYDANLASARLIRFFDIKRELFCYSGYNGNDSSDRSGCLGRDLRLSDFSKEDLELWKETGFIQLCGMRDRAKRPIVVMFGKVIMEANIPTALVLRAYMYACNLWSRDESTQRAGIVVIAYNMFTGASSLRHSSSLKEKGMETGIAGGGIETNIDEGVIKKYLKQTYPLTSQIIKVGMSVQLRGVSMHFCIDHHILKSQYEKIAGYMSTASAARFRCHYASPKNPESYILGTSNRNDNDSVSSVSKNNDYGSNGGRDTVTNSSREQESDKETSFDSTVNPHKELLYTLMTFGIPRETIPIEDTTGEVQLELHQAILRAIEEQEDIDRSLEEAERSTMPASTVSSPAMTAVHSDDCDNQKSGEKIVSSLVSSTASNKLWMSLTASTGSSSSFALFPNLLADEEVEEGSNHSAVSLFGSPPSLDETDDKLPDISSSFSASFVASSSENSSSMYNPAAPAALATSEVPRRTERPPSNPSTPILVPTPNDIIMGRGPWNRNHAGNIRLKAMIERERDRYESVNRFERMRIVDGMLNELYHDCGARFLFKPKPKQSSISAKTDGIATNDVWLEAKRDKAHDKITHDFRNLRRQKNVPPKSSPVHNHKFLI